MCVLPTQQHPTPGCPALSCRARPPFTAVAVIDSYDRGQLLGCLSMSDLRGILPEHFEQVG